MPKSLVICALCIISAAVGVAIDHYILAASEQGGPPLVHAVTPKQANAAPGDSKVEVLGDRVRCDVRYAELKIPPAEYQSFKRKCMGDKYSDND